MITGKTHSLQNWLSLNHLHQILLEEDEEDLDIEHTPICNYSEAIKWLDDIKLFLESKGQCEEASAIGLAAESVAAVHLRSKRQTSILDYCTYHLMNKLCMSF